MNLIISWLVNAVAVLITAYVLPGVYLSGFGAALIVALILGLLNALVRPLLLLLTLPLNLITLGLFTFVVNAVIILIASGLSPGFSVGGFWRALLFSLILAVVSYLINAIMPGNRT